jgi:hypothetical protein
MPTYEYQRAVKSESSSSSAWVLDIVDSEELVFYHYNSYDLHNSFRV